MDREVQVKHYEIPECIRGILKQRGITKEEEITEFLYPKLSNLRQPSEMHNANRAAELIEWYIENELQIIIWGDYDVDGTTGTALLVLFFREMGVRVQWHIPNRLTDGYGINTRWFYENICSFSSKKFLLITVDSGISNRDEIDEIRSMGGDVIVTDHHSIPKQGIPDCIVVNPSQQECGFHQDKLAGVGVAFYLIVAIKCHLEKIKKYTYLKTVQLKKYLAFVAIGTVADMVPVTPLNRILVRGGMEALRNPGFQGLSILLKQSEIHNGYISSEDIGFLLGPKINAAGRLGNSRIVVDILTETDKQNAQRMAKDLEELNKKRKAICENDIDIALRNISEYRIEENGCCILFGKYHLGVAGIVASKLSEKFSSPAIVLAKGKDAESGIYHGSGRSIEGIHLTKVLEECSDILERFGGHDMAAGLTIKKENMKEFTIRVGEMIKKERKKLLTVSKAKYDISCSIDAVMSKKGLYFFHLLEPFGPGNPPPKFFDEQALIINSKEVGRSQEHLNITFRGRSAMYKGIGFGLGKYKNDVQEKPYRKLVYSITKNRYRGTESWQVLALSL